jgi:hypothetical protein
MSHVSNLISVWDRALPWEREEGAAYYDSQRERILRTVRDVIPHVDASAAVAAFCVLSPNNDEASNYVALLTCSRIVIGELPEHTKVRAYGRNKTKAMALLRGASIQEQLRGRKVTSFYHNTMRPECSQLLTIDGHMYGAWIGKRISLKRIPNLTAPLYAEISEDVRMAAAQCSLSGPRFQSVTWLAWKRIHRILDHRYSQLSFDFAS